MRRTLATVTIIALTCLAPPSYAGVLGDLTLTLILVDSSSSLAEEPRLALA
jgi:energy-converting hydrogenase Eha subunit B